MSETLGIAVVPSENLALDVARSHIVTTMTNAAEPVLFGAWLSPGTHVNAAGSNRATSAEIDAEVVRRADIIAVENFAQAQVESGDLLAAERAGTFDWKDARLLEAIVARQAPSREEDDQITLFESLGIGLWDIAAANYVYDRALEQQRGREVDIPG